MSLLMIGMTALVGLYMAWNIGANDVANSMAAAVGSNSISVKRAVILAGICEFAGAVLVGACVTDTVRKGIVDPSAISSIPGLAEGEAGALLAIGMGSALLAAAMWLNLATWMGMPVSTSHAVVGAVAGFGIAAAGWSSVHWGKMAQIIASWFISPVAGGILGFTLFTLISKAILGRERPVPAAARYAPLVAFTVAAVVSLSILYKGLKHILAGAEWLTGERAFLAATGIGLVAMLVSKKLIARRLAGKERLPLDEQLESVEGVFAPLVVISSCAVAFAHGANDVANAVGPLAAVVDIIGSGAVKMEVHVPFWVLALGGTGIVIGLATYGYKVMHTVGTKITQLTPSRGVAASIAAASTVLVCTKLKLPVSTTHTLVGAVVGIGLARGLAAVNRGVTREIFKSWVFTVPAATILTVIFFLLGKWLLLETVRCVVVAAAAGA